MADYISQYNGQDIDEAVRKVMEKEIGGRKYYDMLTPCMSLINSPTEPTSDEIITAFGGKENLFRICAEVKNDTAGFYAKTGDETNVTFVFADAYTVRAVDLDNAGFMVSYPNMGYNYNYILTAGIASGVASFSFSNKVQVSASEDDNFNFVCDNLENKPTFSAGDNIGSVLSGNQGVVIRKRLEALETLGNIVVMPDITNLTAESTSDEIYAVFGGTEKFNAFTDKVKEGNNIFLLKGSDDRHPDNVISYLMTSATYIVNPDGDYDLMLSMDLQAISMIIIINNTGGTLSIEVNFTPYYNILGLDNMVRKPPSDGKTYGMKNGEWVEITTA